MRIASPPGFNFRTYRLHPMTRLPGPCEASQTAGLLKGLDQTYRGYRSFMAPQKTAEPEAAKPDEPSTGSLEDDVEKALKLLAQYGVGSFPGVVINRADPAGRFIVAWKDGNQSTTVRVDPSGRLNSLVFKGGASGVKNRKFEVGGGGSRELPMNPPGR